MLQFCTLAYIRLLVKTLFYGSSIFCTLLYRIKLNHTVFCNRVVLYTLSLVMHTNRSHNNWSSFSFRSTTHTQCSRVNHGPESTFHTRLRPITTSLRPAVNLAGNISLLIGGFPDGGPGFGRLRCQSQVTPLPSLKCWGEGC